MRHITEQHIKRALDGTFTRICQITGASKTLRVDDDFEPSHLPYTNPGNKGMKRAEYRKYTPADDELILAMKAKHYSAARIARILGRDDSSVLRRCRMLRKRQTEMVPA